MNRHHYPDRYRQLAYERRIARYGLPALLEPYTVQPPRVPEQSLAA